MTCFVSVSFRNAGSSLSTIVVGCISGKKVAYSELDHHTVYRPHLSSKPHDSRQRFTYRQHRRLLQVGYQWNTVVKWHRRHICRFCRFTFSLLYLHYTVRDHMKYSFVFRKLGSSLPGMHVALEPCVRQRTPKFPVLTRKIFGVISVSISQLHNNNDRKVILFNAKLRSCATDI